MTIPSIEARPPALDGLVPGAEPIARSQWQLFRRRFFRHRAAVISLVVLALLLVACFGAPWLAPYPHSVPDIFANTAGPTAKHWFGVDEAGRDELSQVMFAGRVSLEIGLAVAFLSTVFGVAVGAYAGYYGGWVDQLLSRTTDLVLVVPDIVVLALLLRKFGDSYEAIIFVLAALGWTYVARVLRGEVLAIKEKEFVEAARASGASGPRIIVRHILPNAVGSITVNATLAVAAAIGAESALSFLGLGVQPPQTSWGAMLAGGEEFVSNPHLVFLVIFPGLFLVITVLAVSFLGDGLRDAFDPRTQL